MCLLWGQNANSGVLSPPLLSQPRLPRTDPSTQQAKSTITLNKQNHLDTARNIEVSTCCSVLHFSLAAVHLRRRLLLIRWLECRPAMISKTKSRCSARTGAWFALTTCTFGRRERISRPPSRLTLSGLIEPNSSGRPRMNRASSTSRVKFVMTCFQVGSLSGQLLVCVARYGITYFRRFVSENPPWGLIILCAPHVECVFLSNFWNGQANRRRRRIIASALGMLEWCWVICAVLHVKFTNFAFWNTLINRVCQQCHKFVSGLEKRLVTTHLSVTTDKMSLRDSKQMSGVLKASNYSTSSYPFWPFTVVAVQ